MLLAEEQKGEQLEKPGERVVVEHGQNVRKPGGMTQVRLHSGRVTPGGLRCVCVRVWHKSIQVHPV